MKANAETTWVGFYVARSHSTTASARRKAKPAQIVRSGACPNRNVTLGIYSRSLPCGPVGKGSIRVCVMAQELNEQFAHPFRLPFRSVL